MSHQCQRIKLMIADDHQSFRERLRLILKNEDSRFDIIGEAENQKQLLWLVEKQTPDIIVTHLTKPYTDTLDTCRYISSTYSSIGIIALSSYHCNHLVNDIFEAGAKGYLSREAQTQDMFEAIEAVHNGGMYYRNSSYKLFTNAYKPVYKSIPEITFNKNELSIIKLICKQLTTKEIADKLCLKQRTIEDYSKKIKEKVDAKNLVGIALYAVRNNIIGFDECGF